MELPVTPPKSLARMGHRGRYAPSPTGALHLGNLRTALVAWLDARSAGAPFVLRIEDLDTPRVRPGALAGMLADLRWLGLYWDEGPEIGGPFGPYQQARRQAIYRDALATLRARGLLYPCYCSRQDLARQAPEGEDEPPYPGTCRALTIADRRRYEAAGRRPAWRWRVPAGVIAFDDGGCGPQAQDVARDVGDVIVWRRDGIIAYQLAVVVDDALMDIQHVVRGADLLGSTARQIALFRALGYPPLRYTHVPLLTDERGAKLAKREQAAGLEPLRAAGTTPEQVIGRLAQSAGRWPAGTPVAARDLVGLGRR